VVLWPSSWAATPQRQHEDRLLSRTLGVRRRYTAAHALGKLRHLGHHERWRVNPDRAHTRVPKIAFDPHGAEQEPPDLARTPPVRERVAILWLALRASQPSSTAKTTCG